jgi:hypothetical protein
VFLILISAKTIGESESEITKIISGIHVKVLISIVDTGFRDARVKDIIELSGQDAFVFVKSPFGGSNYL